MRGDSPVVRAVLYLDAGDLNAVQVWHDAAEAALLPMVQPPGAPAVERKIEGLVVDEADDQVSILPGTWADAMVPDLYQLWTSWDYGDVRPHGPVALTRLQVFRPGPGEFLWLDLMALLADPGVRPAVCDAMVAVLRDAGDVADPVYGEILVDSDPVRPSTPGRACCAATRTTHTRRAGGSFAATSGCRLSGRDRQDAGRCRVTAGERRVRRGDRAPCRWLLLRATEDPAAWNDEAVRRVFEAVRRLADRAAAPASVRAITMW